MSNWKLINQTYLYDGTFDGLLTIIFECYLHKTLPQKIIFKDLYYQNFLDKTCIINTDITKSKRVFDGIYKNIGYDALYNSFYAFLANSNSKELSILKYICNGFDVGPKINSMLTISYVYDVISLRKKALSECHKLKGLLRFMEVGENLYYASLHPEHNILEPLGHHFMNRLPNQDFIIHDKNRELCFLYHNRNYEIVDSHNFKIPEITVKEKNYQDLWKMFFKTIAISERKNSRCQMQFMPKKYWKDLVEMN